VDQANWPEVAYVFCSIFLRDEDNVCLVKQVQILTPLLKKEVKSAEMSARIMGQHFLKNSPVKPSGPGALSKGSWHIACQISPSEKGPSREERSGAERSRSGQEKSRSVAGVRSCRY
jgi:hypothetical protein